MSAGGASGTIEVEIRYLMDIAQQLSIATTNLVNMQDDIKEHGVDIQNLTTQFQIISGEMKQLAGRTSTSDVVGRTKEHEQLMRDVAILLRDSDRTAARMNSIYVQIWGSVITALVISICGVAWSATQNLGSQTQKQLLR